MKNLSLLSLFTIFLLPSSLYASDIKQTNKFGFNKIHHALNLKSEQILKRKQIAQTSLNHNQTITATQSSDAAYTQQKENNTRIIQEYAIRALQGSHERFILLRYFQKLRQYKSQSVINFWKNAENDLELTSEVEQLPQKSIINETTPLSARSTQPPTRSRSGSRCSDLSLDTQPDYIAQNTIQPSHSLPPEYRQLNNNNNRQPTADHAPQPAPPAYHMQHIFEPNIQLDRFAALKPRFPVQ